MENKRNIVIDIGNTRIKSGLFQDNELSETKSWGINDITELISYSKSKIPDQVGIISVGADLTQSHFLDLNVTVIDHKSKLPVKLNYKTPDTLGIDRLVGVIGAMAEFPAQNALVIDMGSCITYDLVSKTGVYLGGVIAPGLRMRMKAMATQTKSLPDISSEWENYQTNPPGRSTRECLSLGSYNAIIHELNGFIDEFCEEYPDLVVILTGGDSPSFESKLKQPIFADLNLVLKGLNRILKQE